MKKEEALALLPESSKKILIILSGGLDSTILMRLAVEKYGAEKLIALSFNYNQKQKIELRKAAESTGILGVEHRILDLAVLGELSKGVSANVDTNIAMPTIKDVLGDPSPKTEVPFRNMILLSIASSFAQANKAEFILTGLQATDNYNYWDTTSRFVDKINNVLSENRITKIKILAPFINITKTDELLLLLDIDQGVGLLKHSVTCYNPDPQGRSCRKCPSCAERIQAFINTNQIDPVEYQ